MKTGSRPRNPAAVAPRKSSLYLRPLLIADVNGDEIIVRTLGFFAYAKPSNAPQLILKRRTATDDHALLAAAWQAANDKARELGWIV
jgi:hypothetical protein